MSCNLSNEGTALHRYGGSIRNCKCKALGMERSVVCSKNGDKNRITAAQVKMVKMGEVREQGTGQVCKPLLAFYVGCNGGN